ncbi:hypothetical protein OBBRIDRAFT_814374 [Obba rivulosa]|uniref:Uncharacterized protein n=1 Tax=Obba rivulosa TaxID=1052685 RepID=A0A8E2DHE7_9APHY|nr:hypothetical protein OBBRIDRAFT_814374 [Obba rivulosa]
MVAATIPTSSPASLAPPPPATTTTAAAAATKDAPAFEFTRRKRWADLLVTELSDAIVLVLSADATIWYCGAAVVELLGWRDEELVDGALVDLMNADDRARFRTQYAAALRARTELRAYVRLQCKHEFCVAPDYSSRPREVFFELTGRAHFRAGGQPRGPSQSHSHAQSQAHASAAEDGGPDFLCFFAVAKPYPGRNTAMLHTFLELKMENERLQQRLATLRAQSAALEVADGSSTMDATPSSAVVSPLSYPPPYGRPNEVYYPSGVYHDAGAAMMGAGPVGPGLQVMPGTRIDSAGAGYAHGGVPDDDDDDDEAAARKKHRRAYSSAEQHVCVTCGRTDSPEWRKGPLGPKTLCNACGLRWAKKVRKGGEADEGEGGTGSVVF